MNSSTHTLDYTRYLDIIAFRVQEQEYCVETRLVREIRGWSPCTPIPHSPPAVLGVISLRGTVIPIIDLAEKLGMQHHSETSRSAIVVVEYELSVVGFVVDKVSDILTVNRDLVQPLPETLTPRQIGFAEGMIASEIGLMCLLNVERLLRFDRLTPEPTYRAA